MLTKDNRTWLDTFSIVTGVIGLVSDVIALVVFIASYNLFSEPTPVAQQPGTQSLYSIWDSSIIRGITFCFLFLGIWGLITIFYQQYFLKSFLRANQDAVDYYRSNEFVDFIEKSIKPLNYHVTIQEISLSASVFVAMAIVSPLFLIWLRVFYIPSPVFLIISLCYGMIAILLCSLLLIGMDPKRGYLITTIISFAIIAGMFLAQEIFPFLGVVLALLASTLSGLIVLFGLRFLATSIARGLAIIYIPEDELIDTSTWLSE